jgi:hypothetical protein
MNTDAYCPWEIDEKWKRKKEFTKTKNLLLKNKIG